MSKTITSGQPFQDPQGNAIANGFLILTLSQPAEVTSGGGQIAPKVVAISLAATGKIPGSTTIFANDELTPSGTTYTAELLDSGGNIIANFGQWSIAGASPIDLSLQTPTTTGASYPAPVLTQPAAQQTINGQDVVMEGAAVGFSGSGSTVGDVFLSRQAANVAQLGTTDANALATLRLAAIQGPGPKFQQFTSSGTFTIPTGITQVKVTIVGGGGAGGGATAGPINGGGGGGAGVAFKWLTGLTPANTLTVTVGAGGTGVSGAGGNAGGNSSVASGTQTISTITANGGGGGAAGAANSNGGGGGSTSGADIGITGTSGGFATSSGNVGGFGAPGFMGGGGAGASNGGAPNAAVGIGAGGAGGGGAATQTGGAGSTGIVIFEWVN